MGVQVSSDVVVGEVWVVLLILFAAVATLEFAMDLLFPLAMLSRFGSLSPMVVLRGRGCCGMWVSGFRVCRCESVSAFWI